MQQEFKLSDAGGSYLRELRTNIQTLSIQLEACLKYAALTYGVTDGQVKLDESGQNLIVYKKEE